MDLFHRKSQGEDTRIGRECQFCYRMDPEFSRRDLIDRLIYAKMDDIAAGHMTEEGYIRHRIAELKGKQAANSERENFQKSA